MSLFNSMVRGFGSQIGRRAANSMIDSRPTRASKSQWVIAGILLILIVWMFAWAIKEAKKRQQIEKQQITTTQSTNIEIPKLDTYKGHTVYTGKRGGRYYYSKSGKKVYIK